jgi:FkbM family methyltransferase
MKNNRRFLPFSLPIQKKQIFYDKKSKCFLSFKIDSIVEFYTAYQIFYNEEYDLIKIQRHRQIYEYYEKSIKEGKQPLIIDCGGNIGLSSKYFSLTYPAAKITCIEPDNKNITSAKLNNDGNIDFFEVAIGCIDSTGRIFDPKIGNNAYRIIPDDFGGLMIKSVPYILSKYPCEEFEPFLIKIDIEGFEENLFSQNTDWINLFPVLIIELHDWMLVKKRNSGNFLKAISKLDRDFIYIGENIYSISNTLI